MKLDAGLRWILIVVGLLAGNVLAVVLLISAAGPAGDDRVVPDYYEKAAKFDDEMAAETASAKLGWSETVGVAGGVIEVRLRDAAGQPVVGAHVEVSGYHRAHAGAKVTLAPVESGEPGVYRAPLAAEPGLWDLTVRSAHGHATHLGRYTVEAR